MRIRELSLRNYRVFEEVDLELPARVIGVFGPNGAGKTSIVESIAFALYGRTRTDKKLIRTHGVLTDAAVRLVFEHGGQPYEVRRTIRGRNHHVDAELFVGDVQLAAGVTEVDAEIQRLLRMDHKVFRASAFAEQKQLDAFSEYRPGERKEMVLRLLGIRPVDEARTAARKQARERKADAERMAGALPDLAEREQVLDAARAEEAEWRQNAEAARRALGEAEGRAAEAEESFEESDRVRERAEQIAIERRGIEQQAEHHRTRHEELGARIEGIRRDLEELPELEKARGELADAADRLAAARRLTEVVEESRELEQALGALPAVDAEEALAELRQAETELQTAHRSATRAESAHERAGEELALAEEALSRAVEADPSQPCPTCGRPLGDDFAEYVTHCRAAVRDRKRGAQGAARKARQAVAAVKRVERRHRDAVRGSEAARTASGDRSRIEDQLARNRRRLEELAEPFGGEVPDVDRLADDAGRARRVESRLAELAAERKRLAEAEKDVAKAAAALAECRGALTALDQEEGGLAFDPEEHARRRKERDEARRLLDQARTREREASDRLKEAAARVKEVRAEIRKVKEIAATAGQLLDQARLLDRVSGLLEGFRTFLYGRIMPQLSRDADVLFRELTNHEYEDLRIDEESLAIHIADAGQYFSIERFSGSESDLANLALRVAISQHLSRMAGADVGMMVLDEVLGGLDAERKDLFVQAIGRLSGRFHQLFVITHAEQVKDHFPASIEVRKVGRRRSEASLV
jgi:exonuclease SbcC